MFQFTCTGCQATLRATDDRAGEKGRCPKCHGVMMIPGKKRPISRGYEQCRYAMEVSSRGVELGGFVTRHMACCKNKKVGIRGFEKLTDFEDFSRDDENTQSGVAYRIKSTERCFSCSHFRQK